MVDVAQQLRTRATKKPKAYEYSELQAMQAWPLENKKRVEGQP